MSNLDSIIKDINKKYKTNIINIGITKQYNIDRIPFSSPRLNYMLYGGIPVGRLVEFSGDEGSGKTTTALDLVAQCQKKFPDKKVVYMDCEQTFDEYWATLLGVDVNNMVLIQPDEETAEQLFEIALTVIDSGDVSMFVIDSIGVMVSQQAYQKSMEEKTYGGISQALTLFSKKVIPLCSKHKCTLIGINQMREDMNSMYGGTITTGGKAWKHNCSVRLQFRKGDFIDDNGNKISRSSENPAGNLVQCSIVKSKVCRSDRKSGYYTLRYLDGIDFISDLVDVALKEGFIVQGGAWFTFVDSDGEIFCDDEDKPLKFQGKSNVCKFLLNNDDWCNRLNEMVINKII